VTGATLKVFVNTATSADSRNLVAEWAPSAVFPIAPSDWTLSSSANALAGAPISSITAGQVDSFALTELGNISTSGYTILRLHVDGGQPSGDNYVQFAASEDGTVPAPQLVINWTTGP
jgi:hypothetical protein